MVWVCLHVSVSARGGRCVCTGPDPVALAMGIAYRLLRVVQLGQLLREALVFAPPLPGLGPPSMAFHNDVALVRLQVHATGRLGHDLDHGRDGHSRVRLSARHRDR